MNLNTNVINENKVMVKDNSKRNITVILKDNGTFDVNVIDKKTEKVETLNFTKIGEVTRKFDNRDWEPVKEEKPVVKKDDKPAKNKTAKKSEKAEKPETKEPQGDDVVTLKECIEELVTEGKLSKELKMKKVRRILRGNGKQDKGMHLREISVDGFRWIWTTNWKDDVKAELIQMFK